MGMCRTAALAVLLLLATVARPISSEFVEYYDLLGVPRDASTEELKTTYRKRSVDLHPDKNQAPDAVEQFQHLQSAYECLSNPASRHYYDTYEETWAEMKEYKEKHLKSMQHQTIQQDGRLHTSEMEVDLEEMFWGDRHVQMLHQSFAARLIGNFPGVWVLFFGDPNCEPCRQTVPQISKFAGGIASSRDWLRVGTVNMGVDANGNLLEHFGAAARRVPQIVLVAPASGAGLGLRARLADFEIFDRGEDFQRRLLGACERLRASAVPELGAVPGGGLAPTVASGQRAAAAAAGPDADPDAKWAVLVVDGSDAAAGLAPVFRRLARRTRHAGFVFRVLRCGGDDDAPAALSERACREAGSFPELRLYGSRNAAAGGKPELLLATDLAELLGGGAEDAERYGYDPEQIGFGIVMETVLRSSSPGEGRFPKSVAVTGCPILSGSLNGPLALIGTSNGRPLYKRKSSNLYLRWLLASQRGLGKQEGFWIISDTPEPVTNGWAYMVLDQLVPIGGDDWMIMSTAGDGHVFKPEPGMMVVHGEDLSLRKAGREAPSAAGGQTEPATPSEPVSRGRVLPDKRTEPDTPPEPVSRGRVLPDERTEPDTPPEPAPRGRVLSEEEKIQIYSKWEDTEDTTRMWKIVTGNSVDDLEQWLSADPGAAWLRSSDGRGPMWWAFESKNQDITAILMKIGVPHMDIDKYGQTPMALLRG